MFRIRSAQEDRDNRQSSLYSGSNIDDANDENDDFCEDLDNDEDYIDEEKDSDSDIERQVC